MEEAAGRAGDLHRDLPAPDRRRLRVCEVTAEALVLGSSQRLDDAAFARARALGLEVVRRRSGGGAVLLAPGGQVWVDLAVPTDDDVWEDDVGRSGVWLGAAWAEALRALGVERPSVHRGRMLRTDLSDAVCFAGLAPGEVTVGRAKVVGVSQRRSREGGVFQCTVPLVWDPSPMAAVLGLDAPASAAAAAAATALFDLAPQARSAGDVVRALADSLP